MVPVAIRSLMSSGEEENNRGFREGDKSAIYAPPDDPNAGVIAGLDPAIHSRTVAPCTGVTEWMPGSSPGMTTVAMLCADTSPPDEPEAGPPVKPGDDSD
jgi:hypothetical protein